MGGRSIPCLVLLLLTACPAWAHQALGVGNLDTSIENPILVEDPDLSQVAYFEATQERPRIWLRFEATEGAPLLLQLGVPLIDRYAALRPALALFGPGMSPVEVPFTPPATEGGMVFETQGTAPTVFDEPFTGTELWQWEAEHLTAPATGTYYLVGYLPRDDAGKFMVILGVREAFSLDDILSLPRVVFSVRAFHEVGPVGGLLLIIPMALIAIFVAWLFFPR